MEYSREVILYRKGDNNLVKTILSKEFGFAAKFGQEFEVLTDQQQKLTLMIERKGMEFKIARANFDSACSRSKTFLFAAHRVVFEDKPGTPAGIHMQDVEGFFNLVFTLRRDIEELVEIYNAAS
jgi:hypothetical protein